MASPLVLLSVAYTGTHWWRYLGGVCWGGGGGGGGRGRGSFAKELMLMRLLLLLLDVCSCRSSQDAYISVLPLLTEAFPLFSFLLNPP